MGVNTAVPSNTAIPGLDTALFRPHTLHDEAAAWPETNCYIDLWIGVLHALGHEPTAMLPFCFGADFEGDQWTFLKPSLDDLWTLYGIEVQELNLWDVLPAHIQEQVARGHLPLVEVDSFYLPDTVGTAYRSRHAKTTIGINVLDLEAERMEYFHNRGYFALGSEDLRRVLRMGGADDDCLAPYAEFAKLSRCRTLSHGRLLEVSLSSARRHLERRPSQNPFGGFRAHLAANTDARLAGSADDYHRYAFASVRQLGAAFQMAAAYLRWLEAQRAFGLADAAVSFDGVSDSAKALLFKMARAVNTGKPLQYGALLDTMEANWQAGFDALSARLGCP